MSWFYFVIFESHTPSQHEIKNDNNKFPMTSQSGFPGGSDGWNMFKVNNKDTRVTTWRLFSTQKLFSVEFNGSQRILSFTAENAAGSAAK